jgi:hypothetical protein
VPVVGARGARRTSADPRELWEKGGKAPTVPPRPARVARGRQGMSVRETSRVIYARDFLMATVGSWGALPGAALLETATVHLMGAAGFTPTPDTLTADLAAVEAAFTGYAPVAATGTGPVRMGANQVGQALYSYFQATGTPPFTPDTVTGWWVQNNGDWVAGGALSGPESVPFAGFGDWLLLSASLALALLLNTP